MNELKHKTYPKVPNYVYHVAILLIAGLTHLSPVQAQDNSQNPATTQRPGLMQRLSNWWNGAAPGSTTGTPGTQGAQNSAHSPHAITYAGGASPEAAKIAEFTRNLTLEMRGQEINFVGQSSTVNQTLQVLNSEGNKAVYLLGDRGAGKTTLVEYLATKAASEIIALDVQRLLAGTQLQGTLQQRIASLITHMTEPGTRRVLFIDEFHAAEKVQGLFDALKPELARGRLSLIAATTTDEFRMYVEKDQALVSRGTKIEVPNPTAQDLLASLRMKKDALSERTGIHISDAALREVARLVPRYFPYDSLYRKGAEIIDQTASRIRYEREFGSQAADNLKDSLQKLEIERGALESDTRVGITTAEDHNRLLELNQEIAKLRQQIEVYKDVTVVAEELRVARQELEELRKQALDLTRQAILQHEIIPIKERTLAELETINSEAVKQGLEAKDYVSPRDIQRTVAIKMNVSVEMIAGTEATRLKVLEARLNSRVLGQAEAIRGVVRSLKNREAGVMPPGKTIANVMLAGGTGTGKSELAKGVAEFYYADPKAITIISGNEMTNGEMATTKLIGSSNGFENADRGGLLTNSLRERPFQVVLIDEFDKMAQEAQRLLMGAMDDGSLKDGMGREVSTKNAIFIFTTNYGAEYAVNERGILSLAELETKYELNRGSLNNLTQAEVDRIVLTKILNSQNVAPELVARMTDMFVMNNITFELAKSIMNSKLNELSQYLAKERNIHIVFDETFIERLTKAAYDAELGARPLQHLIRRVVLEPLADVALSDTNGRKDVALRFTENPAKNGGLVEAVYRGESFKSEAVSYNNRTGESPLKSPRMRQAAEQFRSLTNRLQGATPENSSRLEVDTKNPEEVFRETIERAVTKGKRK